ncbi:hypothetical protein [Caldalkalibacillus mannanilyticus]|uniref:hypothetical protein n=1 Tax=Caldalkalibacillus mannanilyticus TaxID=1418 RepID=UPI000468CEA6|nr:hypothetical protein [Caldalkalibacillus mannanilyticus]
MGNLNVIALLTGFSAWLFIGIVVYRIYRTKSKVPKVWKVVTIFLVGIFSFSIDWQLDNEIIKIPLLPLGVWILFAFLKRKREQWKLYRPYAWLGFGANFIFLLATLLALLLHGVVYPKDELTTYISNVDKALIQPIHPSADNESLTVDQVLEQLDKMKEASFFNEQWYEETYMGTPANQRKERFPYLLLGTEASWGYGLSTMIYVEADGKGILISTPQNQYYFRSEEPFKGGMNHDQEKALDSCWYRYFGSFSHDLLVVFLSPTPFPTDEELIKEIHRVNPKANVSVIQEKLFLDERHVFVPYISEANDYGKSFWVWQHHQWKMVYMKTKGYPELWRLDKKNPATHHIVWNIDPDDQVSAMSFYMVRDRRYSVSGGVHTYEPSVQMEKKVTLSSSYGVLPLSDEWVSFITPFTKVQSAKQRSSIFTPFLLESYLLFGWIPYDDMNQEIFPKRSVNGSGFSNGNIDLWRISILSEHSLNKR